MMVHLSRPDPTSSEALPGALAEPSFKEPPSGIKILGTNEVRYAVVMYGGISLCIYINGVAQELLELARSTSPMPTAKLGASAKVYRRLGQYLGSDSMDAQLLRADSDKPDEPPIYTRFVVDVLSGTSAGGLNSIFLAKALVNNRNMDGLKKLWMEEGDINRLLNDRKSGWLPPGSDPASLLNSQRMYDKLLTALHTMDFPDDPDGRKTGPEDLFSVGRDQPLVEELDLYVTATDLRGLPIYMKLDNAVANELRHKNVFRFRYRGTDLGDFGPEFNPLLAFAGRCTSAIPPAFEPMRLEDIRGVLTNWRPYRHLSDDGCPEWRRIWPDYLKTEETGDFWKRDFGDGGFLDNKPFSYATHELMRRQAARPVRRKLVYVEPTPENLGLDTASAREKPDALDHSLAALVGLPRYETIREDIELVLDRNRLLETIDEITLQVDQDVAAAGEKAITILTREQFARIHLETMIRDQGIGYGIYHRLKVAQVTSDLTSLVSDILNYREGSDEFLAIDKIIERWRHSKYAEDPKTDLLKTEFAFVLYFDAAYRFRRLFFVHTRISSFYRFAPGSPEAKDRVRLIKEKFSDPLPPEVAKIFDDPDPARWKRFREELLHIKEKLADALRYLRKTCGDVRSNHALKLAIEQFQPDKDEVARFRQQPKSEKAEEFIQARALAFDNVAHHIVSLYADVFQKAAKQCEHALAAGAGTSEEGKVARNAVSEFYNHFDHYDMAIFPVQYGAGSYETPHVDVVRVSPNDAKNLCDESTGKRRKLAGREFFSFGAFFADFWRANDMLWGRLDSAEILVRNLLLGTPAANTPAENDPAFRDHPGLKGDALKTVADLVIDDLQTAILRQHLTDKQCEDIWNMLQSLPHLKSKNFDKYIADFFSDSSRLSRATQNLINFCQNDAELLEYFKRNYEVDRQLDRGLLVQLASRSSKIFGRMLQGISTRRGNRGHQQAAFLVRAASIFSGLIELSLPRSAGEILWRYWRSLLYVLGALLFAAGLLFGKPAVQTGGLLVFGVTALVHLTTLWLALWIGRWRLLNRVTVALVSFLLAVLLVLGVWKATELPALVLGRWFPAQSNSSSTSH